MPRQAGAELCQAQHSFSQLGTSWSQKIELVLISCIKLDIFVGFSKFMLVLDILVHFNNSQHVKESTHITESHQRWKGVEGSHDDNDFALKGHILAHHRVNSSKHQKFFETPSKSHENAFSLFFCIFFLLIMQKLQNQ